MACSSGPCGVTAALRVPCSSATARVLVGSTSEKRNAAEALTPGGVREDAADTSPAPPVTSAGSQCSCSCASPWQSQLREPLWAPSLPQAPELIGTGNVTFYCNKIKPISFCQWALTSQIKRFWDPINLSNTALFVNLPLSFPFLFPTVLSVAHPLRGYIPIGNSALTWEVTTSNLLERPIQNCKCAMHTFSNQQ